MGPESYLANFGVVVTAHLSPPATERIEEVDPDHITQRAVSMADACESRPTSTNRFVRFTQLSPENRAKFGRASFWMDMASRQWTMSFSACFASLVIAIESLTVRSDGRPTSRFRNFIETYAPGASLENANEMYSLRSAILHGSDLMEMDQDADFGWDPPNRRKRTSWRNYGG